jgi:A/G-specific adenine glycosylase
MSLLKPRLKEKLRDGLSRWYRRHRRDLPWRRTRDPYRIWVSEIMLQQTTVKTVSPRYEEFLRRFPDVEALARSSEESVLRAWAGLGYYRRARAMREAAIKIRDIHGGAFPDRYEDVLGLPGVGRYTAGAVMSIAFGGPYPLVDGNVARVFARLFGLRGDSKAPTLSKKLWALAEELLDRRAPGDWNQALMELGATICFPAAPRCPACPVARHCAARLEGSPEAYPSKGVRRRRQGVRLEAFYIERAGRVLLWKRDGDERFLKGHWGFPEAGRVEAVPGRLLTAVRHSIMNFDIFLELRQAALRGGAPSGHARWVPVERLKDYLVSSLWLKGLSAHGTASGSLDGVRSFPPKLARAPSV